MNVVPFLVFSRYLRGSQSVRSGNVRKYRGQELSHQTMTMPSPHHYHDIERQRARTAKADTTTLVSARLIPLVADLIIGDVVVDDMDGYEVLKSIHQTPVTSATPFIFLSRQTPQEEIKGRYGTRRR
ncbi:MAG: hypothetical protein QF879_06815 [Candidatus Latescibacteria bacterium]|nr:hypothetical protein [Candidatus Latescibacterota bacterium]